MERSDSMAALGARHALSRRAILLGLLASVLSIPAMSREAAGERTIAAIPPPPGFSRVAAGPGSFAAWLRALPLLPDSTPVRDYRGRIRHAAGDTTIAAVVDLDITGRRLEQCMDILLRLRAEYLREAGRADAIVLVLPDGTRLSWPQWRAGMRPVITGGRFPLRRTAGPDSSDAAFHRYLRTIYVHSGTTTFYHHLDPVPPDSLRIGDVVIRTGRPGHAVMIVDLARDGQGNLRGLVAQGDTPARQLHLLARRAGDPWIPLDVTRDPVPLPLRNPLRWSGLRRLD